MRIAITRPVSPRMDECELTHLARTPVDVALAAQQHKAYEATLQALGCEVIQAGALPKLPDSVFVEDCAVVVDEVAILTRPGVESRRPEVSSMVDVIGDYRGLEFIQPPALLDGGDVLRIGKQIWVGQSGRSNAEGLAQMQTILQPLGYTVQGAEVTGCLHLKSAVTQVAADTVLLNPKWVDANIFRGFKIIETHPEELGAANALLIGGQVIYPSDFARTAQYLSDAGIELFTVENSEVIKAEGGVTCCSGVFDVPKP